MANPRGNPAFGTEYKGRPQKKPVSPAQTDGSVVKRVEAKIDAHMDDLVDVVINHALKNKNAQSALALIERRLGPTNKVNVERDDHLADTLTQLALALRGDPGSSPDVAGETEVLPTGGVYPERVPDADLTGDRASG